MIECNIIGDLYGIFLKQLTVYSGFVSNGIRNDWLLHKYPNHEHFQIRVPRINELKTFFQENSSLQSVEIDARILVENRSSISEADLKLDKLAIEIHFDELNMSSGILKKFWEKGSFKKLHLIIPQIEQLVNEMVLLQPINRLYVHHFADDVAWPQFIHLKELGIGWVEKHVDSMAINLVSLDKISVWR